MTLKHFQTFGLGMLLGAVPVLACRAEVPDHAMHMGASVMPFDLARSTHVFTPDADGGMQAVVSKDGDPAQVASIRKHLRKEAEAFARGDYADPAAIHGEAMPGLVDLQAGADRVRVRFEQLPGGARVRFTTRDPRLVAALHRWFEAQVHDYGSDAVIGR